MTSRSLLLALLFVPLVADAAPKKKTAKKKATTTKTEPAEPTPSEPAAPSTDAGSAAPTTTPAGPSSAPATPAPPTGPVPPPVETKPDVKTTEEPTPQTDADVDSLRQEYLQLRDELFKSRARANTVASQLYSTRVQIKLTYTTARYYNPAKASIRLDGASVYEDAGGAIAGDDGIRFDGYIAPGRHLITFRVEATGKDDDSFTSVTESQIVVKAVAGKDLVVGAKAKDGGDIAYEWKKSEHGSYGLGLDVGVKTIARSDAAAAPAGAKKK
ncbi:MAG TPA: hypothetical protein VGM90_26430 [Kofleriaceae bacterium]|jgi:hypothetical protein